MARLSYPDYTYNSRPTINAIKLLAHSPATVNHWTAVGTAHFRSLALSRKIRELATLYLCAKFQSSYEWDHHVTLSARAGVAEKQREMLRGVVLQNESFFADGEGKGMFEDREIAMLSFLETMVRGPKVSDEIWQDLKKYFSDREIVELVSLQGFYYMICRLGTVLNVDMDEFAVVKAKL